MKKYFKIFILLITLLFIFPSISSASSVFSSINVNELNLNSISKGKVDELKDTIENLSKKDLNSSEILNTIDKNAIANGNINSVDVNSIDMNEVIDVYDELSKVISNDDIANLIDDNKEVLADAGADKTLLSTSSTLLRTFDADAVIDIVQNDLDINEILESYKNGSSLEDILMSVMQNTSTSTKLKILSKLIFSNGHLRLIFALLIVVIIYSVFITYLIFKKAGKHGFATFIPIYRDAVHLKICNFSPWLLILLFIPVFGWLALMAIAIIGRFELAKNFGHGFLFGLGLLFLPIIFRTYIAISSNEYIGK